MKINRTTLILVSIVFDLLDFAAITQAAPYLEIPVLAMHWLYAGPKGLFTMVDMVPGVGYFPFYTLAALMYREPGADTIDEESSQPRLTAPSS